MVYQLFKERSNGKYLYVIKRVAGKQTSTYVGAYTEELYNLLLQNAREALRNNHHLNHLLLFPYEIELEITTN